MPETPESTGCCSFFQNRDCEFFPCHAAAAVDDFNCLFCWCPLYALGRECGGNFSYTDEGVKDCSGCLFPHNRKSSENISSRFPELAEMARHSR